MRYWGRVRRQLVGWLNPRAGKLQIANQIYKRLLPCFVWVLSVFVSQSECLSSTIRFIFAGPILPARHFPRWSRVQNLLFDHLVNPSLTQLAPSLWLDIGLVLFYVVNDLDFVKVQETPAILTSRLHACTWLSCTYQFRTSWYSLRNNPLRFEIFVSDMQVKSKKRQAYTGSKIPANSPNFVNLPGSVVQDRDDNGKHAISTQYQGPVVRRQISANLGLNLNG